MEKKLQKMELKNEFRDAKLGGRIKNNLDAQDYTCQQYAV